MADGSIVFPDDVGRVKRQCASQSYGKPPTSDTSKRAMANNDRVVFPDEVEETKAKEVQETEGTDSNSIEQPPIEVGPQARNVVIAPGNCPPGMTRGADGICREVFNS